MSKEKIRVSAFTLRYETIQNGLISDIGVHIPISAEELDANGNYQTSGKPILWTKALWDTGATSSVITKSTAKKLELSPISMVEVTGVHGSKPVNVYKVSLFLPNKSVIRMVNVTECEDNAEQFGVIIGMDIISRGDFALTNSNNKSTLSFRIPSLVEIDFIAETKQLEKQMYAGVGRNDPCPCGSGKKFKHCHGK